MEEIEASGIDAPVTSEASEKTLTASQVNDIVKREKARAAERAKQEAQAQHQAEIERIRAEAAAQQPANSTDGNEELSESEKKVYGKFLSDLQKHKEQVEKEAQEKELNEVANQYYLKMGKGSELFNDFKEVIADFNPASFPNVVMLAAKMENTPEIMYELANNPLKLQQIEGLAQSEPKLAMKELNKLSTSIAKNLEAKTNNVSAPAPLSQLKSSSVGMDTGKMTIKDFKNAPWLRG